MKILIAILFSIFAISCAKSNSPGEVPVVTPEETPEQARATVEEVDSDESVLNPEEEEDFLSIPGLSKARAFKFAQTSWYECTDDVTGNYTGYNCASKRQISVILKDFMMKHIRSCASKGMAAQGGGTLADLHIVHAGIYGDPNHSPKSLHAENRAIDIKSLNIKLTSGSTRSVVYAGTANRTFYTAFRNCWADVVKNFNGCPYQSTKIYTGSIGWENKDHQYHLHTSVPYCVGGQYGSYYYQR